MFHIQKNMGRDLTATSFFNTVPLLYNALCPSPHNLLYDLRIKSFGLRDKSHICTVTSSCWSVVNRRPLKDCLTFRLLMSYIYGAPILDVSRSHTTTQHSR